MTSSGGVVSPEGDVVWLFGGGNAYVEATATAYTVYIQFPYSDENDGIADVYVDGDLVASIDTYMMGWWFLEISNLEYAEHTVRVATREGSADVHVDYFGFMSSPLPLVIDIKPGSFPNSINLGSKGVVPVAVLSTIEMDAAMVDPATVVFAGVGPLRFAVEDVNGDGLKDLIFHFDTQKLNLTASSTEATLSGKNKDGLSVAGTDSVRIVPPKGKK